jgi:hypothetical protein
MSGIFKVTNHHQYSETAYELTCKGLVLLARFDHGYASASVPSASGFFLQSELTAP